MQEVDPIYQAAREEVARVQAILEMQAELFNRAFALPEEAIEELNLHAELHASGAAIEIDVTSVDIIFSLGVLGRENGSVAWELFAFHGEESVPQWVCTMRVGPTDGEYARRMRGARLIAALGDYMERQSTDARGGVIDFPSTHSSAAWLPSIAAQGVLQTA